MKQDEARKTKHHHTPSIKARQPGRHMKQPDTQREGPAQKLGQDATRDQPKGGGKQQPAGEGSHPQPNKEQRQGSPTTPKVAHKGQREDNCKIAGRSTNKPKHNTEEPQHERNRREDQRQTEGKESTAQNKQNQGSRRGTGPQKGEQKDPHHATASGSKSLSGA